MPEYDTRDLMQAENVKPIKERITVSVAAQVIGQLLSGVIGVAVLKLMTRNLGTVEYGMYVTIFSFVSTFAVLTNLGINSIVAREVAKHPDQAVSIISHNLGLRMGLSLIIIPLISGLGFIFYPKASQDMRVGILLMSLFLFFDAVWAISAAYYSAKVRSDVSAKNLVLQQLIFLVFVITVSLAGWKLFGYITAYVLAIAIGSTVLIVKVRKNIDVRPRANLLIWRKSISASFTLGLISVIDSLYLRIDSVMLSVIVSSTAVGIYGVAYLLVSVFSALPGYIMGAITPSMATASRKDLGPIVQKAFHFMSIFSCILIVVCYLIRKDAVILVSSKEFINSAAPFAILSISTVFAYFSRVASSASVAINKHHRFVFLSIVTLILNISLNLFLIPRYGIIGAAWATVATELLGMVVGYQIFRRQTGIRYELKVIIRPALVALICLFIGLALTRYLHTKNSLINCTVIGFGVTVPYFVILYITHSMPKEMNEVFQKYLSAAKGLSSFKLKRS